MSNHGPRVLGAGLLALDLVVSGEVDVPIRAWAGGTCGNVMAILAWHGWDAIPIARLNNDMASNRVQADLRQFGVDVSLVACEPFADTPIIVQKNRINQSGAATHKFSWTCPRCKSWLPSFKPVTRDVVERVQDFIPETQVFFFDRVSRATLTLAQQSASAGAIVVFEPSGRGNDRLFTEALELAHVVKYSDERFHSLTEECSNQNRVLEIQTLGADGLRFRMPGRMKSDRWEVMKAAEASAVLDTCGSGDWCTAGLLSQIANRGAAGLRGLTVEAVADALRYGQRLAAWNCAFEGARGGMYQAVDEQMIETPVRPVGVSVVRGEYVSSDVDCPKCESAFRASGLTHQQGVC